MDDIIEKLVKTLLILLSILFLVCVISYNVADYEDILFKDKLCKIHKIELCSCKHYEITYFPSNNSDKTYTTNHTDGENYFKHKGYDVSTFKVGQYKILPVRTTLGNLVYYYTITILYIMIAIIILLVLMCGFIND